MQLKNIVNEKVKIQRFVQNNNKIKYKWTQKKSAEKNNRHRWNALKDRH